MRVEVTTGSGVLLFVAKMLGIHGTAATLHQYSDTELPQDGEPIPVKIRGYSDRDRKAVYLEGVISPLPNKVWQVSSPASASSFFSGSGVFAFFPNKSNSFKILPPVLHFRHPLPRRSGVTFQTTASSSRPPRQRRSGRASSRRTAWCPRSSGRRRRSFPTGARR